MKILMFFPGRIDHLPPLMTAATCLAKLGAQVRIVASGTAPESASFLLKHSVELSIEHTGPHPTSYLKRAVLRARIGIRLISEKKKFKPDCIWYHGPFAMEYALIPFINSDAIVIAHAHELCDKELFLGWVSRVVPRRANIVLVPEINRLWMLKISSHSNASFFLVPNRTSDVVELPDNSNSNTRDSFLQHGGSSQCTRFLIYQGAFMPDRCLDQLIQAFRSVPFIDTGLILMGADFKSEAVKRLIRLAKDDKRIVFLPRIPPPNHQTIAMGCIGGILLYAPVGLNNIYCAPNKIYEYASIGLGMILPDYPGISNINKEYALGEVCDPTDPLSIKEAIIKLIHKDPETYKHAAYKFLGKTPKPIDSYAEIYNRIKAINS